MLTVKSITGDKKRIEVEFNEGHSAHFYSFGHAIYSSVSDNLNKASLQEFKKSIEECDWDVKKLEEIWKI